MTHTLDSGLLVPGFKLCDHHLSQQYLSIL